MKKRLKSPSAQKTKSIVDQSTSTPMLDDGYIIFSFRYIQKNHCFSNCQPNEKQALAESIFKRRDMTWKSIQREPRHGLGYEKINQLNVAKPNCVPNGASILSFRFCGKAAMVGFKENDVFHILWLDREYTVYNHG